MNETRKLAAIMFTDIVGYSAMMSKDEKQVMNVLEKTKNFGIMDKMVAYFKSILSSGQNGCNIFEQFLRYIFIVSIFVLSS